MHDCDTREDTLQIAYSEKKPFCTVPRRLKEFLLLRDVMLCKWPGIYIPILPIEKVMTDFKSTYIEQTRVSLEKFLSRVLNIPFIYSSVEVQLFLKGSQSAT
jgi:hypothetical protein